MSDSKPIAAEPWLRGTHIEVPPIARGVLHALELASEDLHRWCGALSSEQLHATPEGLTSVAFHLRHIAGSLDRLLTYAEGSALSDFQLQALKLESEPKGVTRELLEELDRAISCGCERVRVLASQDYSSPRAVGKKQLPTTLGGLLVHIADHTQRHVGQSITMAKLVSASNAL